MEVEETEEEREARKQLQAGVRNVAFNMLCLGWDGLLTIYPVFLISLVLGKRAKEYVQADDD